MPITPFPFYNGWRDYTPALPKIYWDVDSAEQRLKLLMKEYDRIKNYLDCIIEIAQANDIFLDNKIDELADELRTVYDFVQRIYEEFEEIYKGLDQGKLIYDPTQGEYVKSIIAQRNMYRELAVFGLREVQLENIPVEELAKYTVDQVSATGNYTILGDTVPRATDPETGLPYVIGDDQ